jgi:hypothetical protein
MSRNQRAALHGVPCRNLVRSFHNSAQYHQTLSLHLTSANMTSETHAKAYSYETLSHETPMSFRILELLPGEESDPIRCYLRVATWDDRAQYETISYAWGDPNIQETVFCNDGVIRITENLHTALTHFRYKDRERFLWADALW